MVFARYLQYYLKLHFENFFVVAKITDKLAGKPSQICRKVEKRKKKKLDSTKLVELVELTFYNSVCIGMHLYKFPLNILSSYASALLSVYLHFMLQTAHCPLHTAHCTIHTANCTLHTESCTMHIVY